MQPNYKRIVCSTMLYTFLSLLIITAITVAIMFFAFTKNLANFFYNIGCDNMAATLYYKTYEKSDNIFYCYKALNIKITLNDNEDIIKYYDEFVGHEDYNDFIQSNAERNEKLNISVIEKSALLGDENYLFKSYIKALLEMNKDNDATEIAVQKFLGAKNNITLKDQGLYALGVIADYEMWNVFNIEYDGSGDLLINCMQDRFDNLMDIFNIYKSSQDNLDKAYLIMLGNNIINLGQDINTISNEINTEVQEENLNKMLEVNRVIKGLI